MKNPTARAWDALVPEATDTPIEPLLALWTDDTEQAWRAANAAFNAHATGSIVYGISRESYARLMRQSPHGGHHPHQARRPRA